jgi:transcription termination factor Rho
MMQETAMSMAQLEAKTKEELLQLSTEMGIENGALRREEIIFHLLEAFAKQQGFVLATGLLEIIGDGYGFLRQQGLRAGPGDVYISQSQIRRFALRTGDQVTGQVRPPKEGERYFGLIRVEAVNGGDP